MAKDQPAAAHCRRGLQHLHSSIYTWLQSLTSRSWSAKPNSNSLGHAHAVLATKAPLATASICLQKLASRNWSAKPISNRQGTPCAPGNVSENSHQSAITAVLLSSPRAAGPQSPSQTGGRPRRTPGTRRPSGTCPPPLAGGAPGGLCGGERSRQLVLMVENGRVRHALHLLKVVHQAACTGRVALYGIETWNEGCCLA